MNYIYDINKMLPGDIILKRIPGDIVSDRVMSSTHSDYSHAMLYVGSSSYIDVDRRVQARNIQRYIFNTPDDTCLLRLKKNFWNENIISKAIEYARRVIATPYSIRDALNLEDGRIYTFSENTQICTRLVSKAFQNAGLKIVDNIEMCTPQEILNSTCLQVVKGCYYEASELDIKFSKSYDVTNDMVETTDKLISLVSSYGNGELRSLEDIMNYVIKHPDKDANISKLFIKSGYPNVLELDKKYNAYNYDPVEFVRYYKEESQIAALQQINVNINDVQRYEKELRVLQIIQYSLNYQSSYIKLQIELYERIIDSYYQRVYVGMQVLRSKNI